MERRGADRDHRLDGAQLAAQAAAAEIALAPGGAGRLAHRPRIVPLVLAPRAARSGGPGAVRPRRSGL
jgi:hypothetical protein